MEAIDHNERKNYPIFDKKLKANKSDPLMCKRKQFH